MKIDVDTKIAIGCIVQWYEVEMYEEYLDSVINAINFVDNKWDTYFASKDATLTKWMTLIDLNVRLPELLLMRMDKLVMQSAVEARVPFLDHKLVEYV